MIAELNVITLDRRGGRIGKDVGLALKTIDASGLPYKVHSMGTLIEGDLGAILEVVRRCHQAVARKSRRVITTVRIDDRVDRVVTRGRGGARRGRQLKKKS